MVPATGNKSADSRPADPRRRDRLAHAIDIFRTAIAAADPGQCVRSAVQIADGGLRVHDRSLSLESYSRIFVIGAGKATPAMAGALEDVLGARLTAGAINTKYGHREALTSISTTECGHPIPDEAGIEGTCRMRDLVADVDEHTLILCLISGGGSALMPAPAPGISLAEKQHTTQLLLECGAPIDEINVVRKHLSAIKGGLLARLAQPAMVVTLIVSDVIGDRLDTIASGPTYPDSSSFADCLAIAERYDLRARLPDAVANHLESGARGEIEDTPKAGDPCFDRAFHAVIGNNSLALEAARGRAEALGYRPLILSSSISGITREVAGVHVEIAREIARSGQPVSSPACLISGGETTVVVSGTGKGGRNQEFALAAAVLLDGDERITAFSGGTDGTDGPTDAAGAVADGTTVARGRARGREAAADLDNNDSYTFFESIDDLVITGPTGTNVMDLRLMLVS